MSAVLNRWLGSSRGVIAFLGLFLVILEIQSPRFFSWDDNATQFCGYYQYNYNAIVHQKTFPWMVWTQYAGQTNLTQSQCGLFYLPAYLATGLSWLFTDGPFWNIEILILTHLLIGAYGMMRYLRAWNLPPEVAHAAGLLYATTPFFLIVSKSWIFVTYSMAFTPWIFLLVDRLVSDPKKRDFAIYILLKSLFFFQGYSHVWINLSFIEGLYFLWRWGCLWKSRRDSSLESIEAESLCPSILKKACWKILWLYTLAQIIHLLVILPQLWINTQSVHDSPHRGAKISMDQLLAFRLDPSDGFLAQLFYFQPERYLLSSSAILFLGGSVILFYDLYRKIRAREKWPLSHLTLTLFMAITLLLSTSCYAALSLIPPFDILRWPIKFMMIVPFFYAGTFAFFGSTENTSPRSPSSWILLGAALLQMTIVFIPSHQSPLSKLRIHSGEDLQIHWPYQGGRVLPIASDEKYLLNPHLLAYNFGTWVRIPTLAGYDQLISKTNYKIALDLQVPGALEVDRLQKNLPHLQKWGVRYLTGSPEDPQILTLDSIPALRRVYEDSTVMVWEYPAAEPLISSLKNPRKPIPFQMTPSSLLIPSPLESGELVLRFAPHQNLHYRTLSAGHLTVWKSPGINPDQTLKISIPPETTSFELSYRPNPFEIFTFFISGTLILGLLSTVFRRPPIYAAPQ
jgi:hypothetical protein